MQLYAYILWDAKAVKDVNRISQIDALRILNFNKSLSVILNENNDDVEATNSSNSITVDTN